MRILITGADDPLGQRLVERFSVQDEVLAITHGAAPALPVPARQFDPADEEALLRFGAGAQVMVHLADVAHPPTLSWAEATRHTLDGAKRAGVKRVIWVAALSAGTALLEAEAAAIAHPLTTVVLRPTWLLGPGDPRGGTRALLHHAFHDIPMAPFVDLRDLCGAVESALTRGDTENPTALGAPLSAEIPSLVRKLWGEEAVPSPPDWAPVEPLELDVSAAEKHLGWWTRSPEKTVHDALSEFQFGNG